MEIKSLSKTVIHHHLEKMQLIAIHKCTFWKALERETPGEHKAVEIPRFSELQ